MSRFSTSRTAHGWAVLDSTDLGRPVVRAGLPQATAERVRDALNELDEENQFLRAMCRNQGLEIRPTRRAS